MLTLTNISELTRLTNPSYCLRLRCCRAIICSIFAVWVLCGAAKPATAASEAESATQPQSGVRLLRLPFPYTAAVTVCSDTHQSSVELFEGVHKLVNSSSRIQRGSKTWKLLFSDPEIEKRDAWRDGIDGFGLPIADSCWLYDPVIGVFSGYDEETEKPITHSHNGEDFRDVIDRWRRNGWVDTLHTPGAGDIGRKATLQGLQWLQQNADLRLNVWTNHSISSTPTCIEPDTRNLAKYVVKNLVKLGTSLLWHCGARKLAKSIAVSPFPGPFPRGQRVLCWILSVVLFLSIFTLPICLLVRRLRKKRCFVFIILTAVGALGILHVTPGRFGQGDNPGSPYYCADLVRKAGFRYFCTIGVHDGLSGEIPGRLALPERDWNGRSSYFGLMKMDDGVSCLVFPRAYKAAGGSKSLELLTDDNLEELCDKREISILYNHWVTDAKDVFSAKGLDGLRRLQRYYEQKRIWVSRLTDLLAFEFARTFVEFEVRRVNGKRIIDIYNIKSPIGKPFVPTPEDLRGLSFECPMDCPVEVFLGGKPVSKDSLVFHHSAESLIVQFPLATTEDHANTNDPPNEN